MTLTELIINSLPFLYFLFVAGITPGPNNVMLTASGMNFGYRRTLPHVFGIMFGFTALILLCAFGVGAAYNAYPPIQIVLKVLGGSYLLYLSYRIATAGRVEIDKNAAEARPLTSWEAAVFQFVNPKAWVAGLTATSAFLPAEATMMQQALMVTVISVAVCIVSTTTWVLFGKGMARLFTSDKTRRIINVTLALLLVATIPLMVM